MDSFHLSRGGISNNKEGVCVGGRGGCWGGGHFAILLATCAIGSLINVVEC